MSAGMTREERDWLRAQIDQARRERLSRARVSSAASERREYWADYHRRNRVARIAASRARREAA